MKVTKEVIDEFIGKIGSDANMFVLADDGDGILVAGSFDGKCNNSVFDKIYSIFEMFYSLLGSDDDMSRELSKIISAAVLAILKQDDELKRNAERLLGKFIEYNKFMKGGEE